MRATYSNPRQSLGRMDRTDALCQAFCPEVFGKCVPLRELPHREAMALQEALAAFIDRAGADVVASAGREC